MLVYRRYDPALNALPMNYDILPQHVKVGRGDYSEITELFNHVCD